MPYRLLLGIVLLVTAALYWLALDGPYLLDDFWIVSMVEAWDAGQRTWQETLLTNRGSLLNSRPVAMATLMLSTALGGVGAFPLKLGNLLVHLLCGVAGWWLLRRCLRLDPRTARWADPMALLAAAIWLLHPLHASTVLYAVQRMTQVSTLFTLAAVATYVVARSQLRDGRNRAALLNLFVAFPLLLTLGLLSKQNAATAPLLCLVLELAYFKRVRHERAVLGGFFLAFLALPALGMLALLSLAPERLLAGYAEYDFTAWQRLLTQPRVLLDYIGMWFVPRGPQMGLYTDDFTVSTGLLTPITTLWALMVLLAVSLVVFLARKRAPSVFAGWFFFLAAHAVESSFLPLEVYYEHRNYLPSFGLLLAGFGMVALRPAGSRSGVRPARERLVAPVMVAILGVLAFATFGRVLVWKDIDTIVAQGLRTHPDSLRATTDALVLHLRAERYPEALSIVDRLSRHDEPGHRLVGRLNKIAIDCLASGTVDHRDLLAIRQGALHRLSVTEVAPIKMIVNVSGARECGQANVHAIADTFVALLDAAGTQPETAAAKYAVRSLAAQMYARSGDWRAAEHHAAIAWKTGGHLPASSLLIRALIHNGKRAEAGEALALLESELRAFDTAGNAEARALRGMLATGSGPD